MLKPYLLAIFIMSMAIITSAQVRKAYLNKKGIPTTDSTKAASFILFQKLPGDSAWAMNCYDMRDSLISSGTYKDSRFQIKHGLYSSYFSLPPGKIRVFDFSTRKWSVEDDLKGQHYLWERGVYVNGKKSGTWKTYNHGRLVNISTYEDDVLNGPYINYYGVTGSANLEGFMSNGVRQGHWHTLCYTGDTLKTDIYVNGDVVQSVSFVNNKKFDLTDDVVSKKYDIITYLNSKLANVKFEKCDHLFPKYSFNITYDGKLVAPVIQRKSTVAIDSAIVNEFLNAPNWHPVVKNDFLKISLLSTPLNPEPDRGDKIKEHNIIFPLDVFVNKNGKIFISYRNDMVVFN